MIQTAKRASEGVTVFLGEKVEGGPLYSTLDAEGLPEMTRSKQDNTSETLFSEGFVSC